MRFSTVLSSAVLASTINAAPTTTCTSAGISAASTAPLPIGTTHKTGGEEYIVVFDSSLPTPPAVEHVLAQLDLTPEHEDVHWTFNNSQFRGFVASMKTHCLDILGNMTEIHAVEQSAMFSTADTRTGSPWGLQRISSSGPASGDVKALDFTYTFSGTSAPGKDVDIYVLDSGVNVAHDSFAGRARKGFSFDPSNDDDGDGHGTHCAGTAAGNTFGVANGANVIAVKVLGDDGSGLTSSILAGMNFVINNHEKRSRDPDFVGSVMSASWGLNSVSQTVNDGIRAVTEAGIHVSAAAGNSAIDACDSSPGSAGGAQGPAVIVGAVGFTDQVSSFSNTGRCVDVYAPGENVLSAWNTGSNVVNFLSGTSMACPHVSGLMAYLMVEEPRLARDPAAMKRFLVEGGARGVIEGVGDRGVLVSNGERGRVARRGIGSVRVVEKGGWLGRLAALVGRAETDKGDVFVLEGSLDDEVRVR